jgi:hypothetical protein
MNLLTNDGDDTHIRRSYQMPLEFWLRRLLLVMTPVTLRQLRNDLTVANMTYAQKLEEHLVKLYSARLVKL